MDKQNEMEALLRSLEDRTQRDDKKQSKKETFDNGHKFFEGRKMIVNAFKDDLFPLPEQPLSFQDS